MTAILDELLKIGVKDFTAYAVQELKASFMKLPKEKQARLSTFYIAHLEKVEKENNKKYDAILSTLQQQIHTEYQELAESDPKEFKEREIRLLFKREQELVEEEIRERFKKVSDHDPVFLKNYDGSYYPHRWVHIVKAFTAPHLQWQSWEQLFPPISDLQIVRTVSEVPLSARSSSAVDVFARAAWACLEEGKPQGLHQELPLKDLYRFGCLYQHLYKVHRECDQLIAQNAKPARSNSPARTTPRSRLSFSGTSTEPSTKITPRSSPRTKISRSSTSSDGGTPSPGSSTKITPRSSPRAKISFPGTSPEVVVTPRPEAVFQIANFEEALGKFSLPCQWGVEELSGSERRKRDECLQLIQGAAGIMKEFLKQGGAAWESGHLLRKIQAIFEKITEITGEDE